MPRFFFDLSTPERFEYDRVGLMFTSLEEAYLDASQAALDISIDMLRERKDPNRCRFDVRSDAGEVVLELPFSEILQPGRVAGPKPEGHVHERLRNALDRTRRLKAELADAFAQARESALQGLALTEVRWAVPGTVE